MEQHPAPEHRLFKVEQAVLLAEHQEAHHGGEGIPQAGGDGRALDAQVEEGDQRVVQDDVGHAPRHGADQGQLGPVGGNQVQGEVIHQQNGDGEQQVIAQIGVAVAEHRRGEAHSSQQGVHERVAQCHHHRAHHGVGEDQQSKILPGLLLFALPHLLHHHGAAAGGQHPGHRRNQGNGRDGQVDGGQGLHADQVGDEQPVHHGIEGVEHRHHNGREGKAQDVFAHDGQVVRIQFGFHEVLLSCF